MNAKFYLTDFCDKQYEEERETQKHKHHHCVTFTFSLLLLSSWSWLPVFVASWLLKWQINKTFHTLHS